MKFTGITCLTFVVLLHLIIPASEAAIKCSDVVKDLTPCVTYLVNGEGKPSTACCSGASKLVSAASTAADKRDACNCLKTVAQKVQPNAAAAKSLPGSCGIKLPYTISATIDCSKIR